MAESKTAHAKTGAKPGDGKKIVLIEDDRETSSTISGVLNAAGYDVRTANNGIDGQALIEEDLPDLVLTDMMMPKMGGFPVLDFINSLDEKPKVIMITANEGSRHMQYAAELGAADYLRKPFAMELMLTSVRRVLDDDSAEKKPKRKSRKKS